LDPATIFFFVSTKTAATRAALFDSNMHQSLVGWGFPLGGAYSAPPDLPAAFKRPTSKKGEGRGEEGRGGETRRGKGKREFVICPRKKRKVGAYARRCDIARSSESDAATAARE